ncbi:hypothetical protein Ciccas_013722, partial [Cichlidogyrus casuarinus]
DRAAVIRVKKYIDHKYFNCYTIEPSREQSQKMTQLRVLVKLVPQDQIPAAYLSFSSDTFQRGEGVKLVLHEESTLPDIELEGISLQPGRMNEINFKVIKTIKLKLPNSDCSLDNVPRHDYYGEKFLFSPNQCIKALEQWNILQNCQCLLLNFPISFDQLRGTNKSLDSSQFCVRLPNDRNFNQFTSRIECC